MEFSFGEKYQRYLSRQRVKSALWLLLGTVVLSSAFVLFMNPYKIVPGGVYGLGIVMHSLFPAVQVGTFGLLFDLPLLLIGFRVFGRRFGATTVLVALAIPLVMNLMSYWVGEDPATMLGGKMDLSHDMFLVCIFGGVLMGAGLGMIIKTGATSGGTDIVAMLLVRFARFSFSRGVLLVDSLVVLFGLIILGDWRLPLYSLVTIFVSTRVIDFIVDGASYDKLLFILSDKREEIRAYILETMERGGTYIKSSGMYTGAAREMIFLVVSRSEISAVEGMIKHIDPGAFVVIVNAHRTYGDGFEAFPEQV